MFELYPSLKKDTLFIRDLKLCQLLLMNNKFYPWVILVPKKPGLIEIIDLSRAEQILLLEEIDLISRLMKNFFKPDKLNIAALGNIVPQLHIHIISRFKSDRLFPKPVWSDDHCEQYNIAESAALIKKINDLVLLGNSLKKIYDQITTK